MLPLVIPRDLRLHATALVGGACADAVLARLARVPQVGPAHPEPTLARLFDVRVVPRLAVVDAHFDSRDRTHSAPREPADLVLAARERGILVERIDDDAA